MKIVWTNKKESLQKRGIHLYDQKLLRKIMIPYSQRKLPVKSTIYIHNLPSKEKFVVIEEEQKKEKLIERLNELFSIEYKEEPKAVWIKPVGPIRPKKIPTYETTEDDWKYREKPVKKGGVDKWV